MSEKLDLDALERANLGRAVRPEDWMALLAYARHLERLRPTSPEKAIAAWNRRAPESASQPGGAWQPIETAPKDGCSVILRNAKAVGKIADGFWLASAYNGNGAWIWPYLYSEPAYWMPLPAAPSAGNGGAEGV